MIGRVARSWLPLTVLALYCALWWSLPHMPFLDLPSHFTRSKVIGELIWGTGFRDEFAVEVRLVPYLGGDLVLAAITRVLPDALAGMVWVTLSFLALPLGVWSFLRAHRLPALDRAFAVLITICLATSWYFVSGYMNFCIGLGVAFLTLSGLVRFLDDAGARDRSRLAAFALFALGTVACYAIHLAAVVCIGLGTVGTLLARAAAARRIAPRLVASAAPLAAVTVWHLAAGEAGIDYASLGLGNNPASLIRSLGRPIVRYSFWGDGAIFAGLVLVVLYWGLRGKSSRGPRLPLHGDSLALSILFSLAYVALPSAANNADNVNERVLPPLAIFVVVFMLARSRLSESQARRGLAAATLLCLVNLAALAYELRPHDRQLGEYNRALDAVPAGRMLLPIATRADRGRVQFGLHQGELYIVRQGGMTPYLPSGHLGAVISYFHYQRLPYAPDIFWYGRGVPVDWERVSRTYDYIIATKPLDMARVEIPGMREVYSNAVATVFRIEPRP